MALGGREQELVFRELLPEMRARVRSALYKARQDFQHLDDILQDMVVTLLDRWDEIETDGPIWGWVSTTAFRAAIDRHRLQARWESLDELGPDDEVGEAQPRLLPGSGSNPAGVFDPAYDKADCIRRVFDELESEGPARKGTKRTIDLLQFVVLKGDDDLDAVAGFLGSTKRAAAERKSYALKKLRELCVRLCGNDVCGLGRAVSAGST